jgi:DNA mismatch repair ATPase MutL
MTEGSVAVLDGSIGDAIEASCSLSSISSCVLELVNNSIDANSRQIDIEIDLGRTNMDGIEFTVSGDGHGIKIQDLKSLAKNHTTKNLGSNPLKPLYGYKGQGKTI